MTEPWHATLWWDDQAKGWYVSETNFSGLVTEVCTAPALLAKLERLAPELFELDPHLLEDRDMSRTVSYVRVSTAEQDLQMQPDTLAKAGCKPVFTGHASRAKSKRPGFDACVKELKAGDTLVVWRLDRLGPSMPNLVGPVKELLQRCVGFRLLQDGPIDTTTAAGELLFHVPSSLDAVRTAAYPGAKHRRPDNCTRTRLPRWTPTGCWCQFAGPGCQTPVPGSRPGDRHNLQNPRNFWINVPLLVGNWLTPAFCHK